MSVMFVFLAVVATIAIWWLSRQRLTTKPWLEVGAIEDAVATSPPAAKVGLGVFLVVVSSLFALLFSAYMMQAHLAEARLGAAGAPRLLKLLWLNTGLLILGSVAMQWAQG